MKNLMTLLFLFVGALSMFAQKQIDGVVVHGNEWIDYSKTYYKISVTEDGVYKVSQSDLASMGVDTSVPMSSYKLIHLGEEVAISTTTAGVPSSSDYFVFYGERNRDEVDRFVYETDDMILNNEYSIISDQSAYFLTIDESATNKRYEELVNNISSSDTFEDYIWTTQTTLNSNIFTKPKYYSGDIVKSSMDSTEGFSSASAYSYSETTTLNNYLEKNLASKVDIRIATGIGANNQNNIHDITLDIDGVSQSLTFDDYQAKSIETEVVTGNAVSVKVTNNSSAKLSVPHYKVTYTRSLNIGSLSASEELLLISGAEKNYSFETTASNVNAFLVDSDRLVTAVDLGGNAAFKIPSVSADEKLVLFSEDNLKTPVFGEGRQYTDFSTVTTDYVVITHPDLNTTGSVDNYVAYRQSEIGGGYTPLIIDVTELYDQYAYGVDLHFASIRNFTNKVRNIYDAETLFFLIGKGVQYGAYRNESQQSSSLRNFVPTFGNPTSDSQLVSDFSSPIAFFGIGRLAVDEAVEIDNYLNKIIVNEANINNPQSTEDKDWMKTILHLSGGGKKDYNSIAYHLNYMSIALKQPENLVAADLTMLEKFDENGKTVPEVDTEALDIINDGASIVTFFGHGGIQGVDFIIEEPKNFSNEGKLPLVMVLGCNAGNCCTPDIGMSERFINEPEKGASHFLATTGKSYGSDLQVFGKAFYENYGGDFYGKPLGLLINQATAEAFQYEIDRGYTYYQRLGMLSMIQQTLLNGDPAYKLYHSEGADFVFDYESATVDKNLIYSYSDVEFCVDVNNIGSAATESLDIKINIVDLEGNVIATSTQTITSPVNTVNVCQSFALDGLNLSGDYNFTAEIIPANPSIELPSPEANENNKLVNGVGVEGLMFSVNSLDVFPTYPEEFSIVNVKDVTLISTAFDAFADKNNYVVEIDTLPTFDSGYLTSYEVNDSYLPIKTPVTLLDIENQVYYWRVKYNDGSDDWATSSFVYNTDCAPGWNQSHYGQFPKDNFTDLTLDGSELSFDNTIHSFKIINSVNYSDLIRNANKINFWKKSINSGFAVLVFDGTIQRGWLNPKNSEPLYGSVKPYSTNTQYFEFPTTNATEEGYIVNMLENEVPDNATVVVLSLRTDATTYPIDFVASQYNQGVGLLKYLEGQGATKIDELMNGGGELPYAFVYKKNSNEVIDEQLGSTPTSVVDPTFQVGVPKTAGSILSTEIGVSKGYTKFIWEQDASTNDVTSTQIVSIDENGVETVLKTYDTPGIYDISDIDSSLYPNIHVRYNITDTVDKTAVLPNMIRVVYDGEPDLVLERGDVTTSFRRTNSSNLRSTNVESDSLPIYSKDTVLTIPVKVINYSSYDANATYNLTATTTDSTDTQVGTPSTFSFVGLAAGEEVRFEIPVYTSEVNTYTISVLVAEATSTSRTDGLEEETLYNNNGEIVYKVEESLPVELLSFEAKAVNKDALLTWATLTEINNSHFDIERSVDGDNFTKVGTISGNGNSSDKVDYSYTDANANVASVVYYRLKQVDFDGSFDYSNVVEVSFNGNNAGSVIYPNPVKDELRVDYDGVASVKIYNALGKLVTVTNPGVIDVTSYTSGAYLVKIVDANNNTIATETIVVVK